MRRFRSGLEQKKNNIFYGDTLTKRVLSCIFINGKRYSRTRITKQAAKDGRKRLLLKRKKEDSEDEKKDLIVVRGAGDLATGTIHRLKKAGFRLLVLEAEHPAAIRRQVALSEAVYAAVPG